MDVCVCVCVYMYVCARARACKYISSNTNTSLAGDFLSILRNNRFMESFFRGRVGIMIQLKHSDENLGDNSVRYIKHVRYVSLSICLSVCQPAAGCVAGWLDGWLAGWLAGWLSGCLAQNKIPVCPECVLRISDL